MRNALISIGLLAAVGACSSGPAGAPAPTALAGEEVRVGTWTGIVVQDGPLYANPDVAEMLRLVEQNQRVASKALEGSGASTDALESFGSTMRSMLDRLYGAPYGGPGRLVLGLYRTGDDGRGTEAVFLEFSALKPGETDRTANAPDIFGAYHRPLNTIRARLESGRVRIRRTDGGRAEFHVAVIFRVPNTDERLHLITRVEAPLHLPGN